MFSKIFTTSFLAAMPLLASAWDAPAKDGYTRVWQENFSGYTGSSPNTANWNIINEFLGYNQELQTYTGSTSNLQLSGENTLKIVPVIDYNGQWTSGRIESSYTFVPTPGKKTLAEADIRFGDGASGTKKGIWPAFWIMGDNGRKGTAWPTCGEIDVMENINGALKGHGTVHCDVVGGRCNDPIGIQNSVDIPDQGWHTWRVVFDRTVSHWTDETITWYRDEQQFHQVSGGDIGDWHTWVALCYSPMYFILNVAVGGSWPGNPDGSTVAGNSAQMEVAYVAVYNSN